MKYRNLFVVGGSTGYASYLLNREVNMNTGITYTLVSNIKDADVVMFTGGSDVSPTLYNEEYGRHTYCSERRDYEEVQAFEYCKANKIPMIGICRGMQLFNVLLGGKMIQDVTNHCGADHNITFTNGDIQIYPSIHHQMVNPNWVKPEWEIMAVSTESMSRHYLDGNDESVPCPYEIEMMYFPEINSIGIQGHPEGLDDLDPAVLYWVNLINTKLFGENNDF